MAYFLTLLFIFYPSPTTSCRKRTVSFRRIHLNRPSLQMEKLSEIEQTIWLIRILSGDSLGKGRKTKSRFTIEVGKKHKSKTDPKPFYNESNEKYSPKLHWESCKGSHGNNHCWEREVLCGLLYQESMKFCNPRLSQDPREGIWRVNVTMKLSGTNQISGTQPWSW